MFISSMSVNPSGGLNTKTDSQNPRNAAQEVERLLLRLQTLQMDNGIVDQMTKWIDRNNTTTKYNQNVQHGGKHLSTGTNIKPANKGNTNNTLETKLEECLMIAAVNLIGFGSDIRIECLDLALILGSPIKPIAVISRNWDQMKIKMENVKRQFPGRSQNQYDLIASTMIDEILYSMPEYIKNRKQSISTTPHSGQSYETVNQTNPHDSIHKGETQQSYTKNVQHHHNAQHPHNENSRVQNSNNRPIQKYIPWHPKARGLSPGVYQRPQVQYNTYPGYHTYHGNSNLYPNPKVYGVRFYENGGADKGGPYAMYAELSTEDLASTNDQVQPCLCAACTCRGCDDCNSCENGGRGVHDRDT